jgi:hypothetical protein
MAPHERVAYLKEFEDSDKHDTPKRGGLLEKLIARGNKKTPVRRPTATQPTRPWAPVSVLAHTLLLDPVACRGVAERKMTTTARVEV